MLRDDDAERFLEEHFHEVELSRSSHWEEMHATFQPDGAGVRGFGDPTDPPPRHKRIALNAAHAAMQRPYRRSASRFTDLPAAVRAARILTARQGRVFDLNPLRQAITFALLAHHGIPPGPILVIGDGYGLLTALLTSNVPNPVVTINLTRTLLADVRHLRLALPDRSIHLATEPRDLDAPLVAVQADNVDWLEGLPIGLAINVASMQEMDPPVIERYFDVLRPNQALFYCCNRESKTLPDGTLVRFDQYPWRADDRHLVDEPCPWHQRYYTLRPPRYRPYDGPVRHRLTQLAGVEP